MVEIFFLKKSEQTHKWKSIESNKLVGRDLYYLIWS
jgi:hypothetical protein